MDIIEVSSVAPSFHLTRHGGIRLISRTRLTEDALLHLLTERQSVIIENGHARKPCLVLVYSQPDADFFVVAVNRRTGGVITVLPLRLYEYRIPGKPRIVPLIDLLRARNRATVLAGQRTDEPEPSGAIVHLKMIFRRREEGVSREWREAFAIELNDLTPVDNVDTEKALLTYPGFLEKMSEVLSACSDNCRHVYRIFAEVQDRKLPKTRRKIEMPWTRLSIEQAVDPEACERFPALQGLMLDDAEESFDRYSCPIEANPEEDETLAHIPSCTGSVEVSAGAVCYI